MSQKKCFISVNGVQEGPHSIDEIMLRIGAGRLQLTDYIYDESASDWVVLLQNPELRARLDGQKPKAPPLSVVTNSQQQATDGREWFVLKWNDRLGPFSTSELIRMLQEKTVYEFDCVWKKGMESWVRLAEVDLFNSSAIRNLFQEKKTRGSTLSDIFFSRKHARVSVENSVLLHNQSMIWKGSVHELSEGGAGLIMNNASLLPGQKIQMHFRHEGALSPFNVTGEIVNKKYVKGVRHRNAPVPYAVKFLEVNAHVSGSIRDYFDKKRSAKSA